MAIEEWMNLDDVDQPRRHTLGGFRPGQGFAPSESDEDETLTAAIDLEAVEDGDETLPILPGIPRA